MRHGVASIDKITVTDRYRVDLGDVSELARSISEHGLFHPVVVTSDLRLIAGQRRLEACRSLGMTEVPVRIADDIESAVDLLSAERDENTCRKDMTASELYALGKALEELEAPKARARMSDGGRGGRATNPSSTREAVGEALGVSEATWGRLKRLGDAAASGNEGARDQLRAVDAGSQTLYGADSAMREARKTGKDAPPPDMGNVGDVRSVPRKGNSRKHLLRLAEQIKNLGDFAKTVDVDGLTKDEADSIAADLTDGLAAIRNLRNQLRKVST